MNTIATAALTVAGREATSINISIRQFTWNDKI
jgi:hypothetical protein